MPVTGWAEAALTAVRAAFAPAADPERAAAMAAYMKDRFAFFGIGAPDRRRLARAALAPLGRPTPADALAFAHLTWAEPERELQYTGEEVLRRRAKDLPAAALDEVRTLVATRSWWDTVDALAAHDVGTLVATHDLGAEMDRWALDDDRWVARAAILHQLRYGAATDADRLFRHCLARAGDTDFFLRKAIGWALRQHSKTDPGAVAALVDAHEDRLSALSVREARKHLG